MEILSETYKKLEKGKWVSVGGWHDTKETYDLIFSTHDTFLKEEKSIESKM